MSDDRHRLICGDALAELPKLDSGSVDAVVTDPPAGISFMGKEWDSFPVRRRELEPSKGARKDGGSQRGFACGFDGVSQRGRNTFIAFLSSVFVEVRRVIKPGGYALVWAIPRTSHWTATALEDAGWEIRDRISHLFGQGFPKGKGCLKPACEDWWLCRAPGRGVRPLGIAECRIGTTKEIPGSLAKCSGLDGYGKRNGRKGQSLENDGRNPNVGRWPANVVLDEEAAALLDEQSGERKNADGTANNRYGGKRQGYMKGWRGTEESIATYGDSGGASRFFYCSKASRKDRGDGNTHPTVKSTALMSWLCKLVCPPGGTVLDPFAGSGSTGVACLQTGRRFVGVELSPEYHAIAARRLAAVEPALPLEVTCAHE